MHLEPVGRTADGSQLGVLGHQADDQARRRLAQVEIVLRRHHAVRQRRGQDAFQRHEDERAGRGDVSAGQAQFVGVIRNGVDLGGDRQRILEDDAARLREADFDALLHPAPDIDRVQEAGIDDPLNADARRADTLEVDAAAQAVIRADAVALLVELVTRLRAQARRGAGHLVLRKAAQCHHGRLLGGFRFAIIRGRDLLRGGDELHRADIAAGRGPCVAALVACVLGADAVVAGANRRAAGRGHDGIRLGR